MSHKEIPCPRCRRVWLWSVRKPPEEAYCPKEEGCNIIPDKSDTETMIQDNFNEILRRLDEIEKTILDEIEKTILDRTVPQYPSYPIPTTPLPSPYIPSKCAKCGITLNGVMGYVCNDQNCPTFMKVTC